MSDLVLGGEFSKGTQEAWLALVDKALKGADFDKALVSTTYDGLRIEPLYTAADAATAAETPGASPFTRGAHGADGREPAWQICQIADHPDPAAANAALLEDLQGGASAVAIKAATGDGPGVRIEARGDLGSLLEGVLLDLVDIHLDAGDQTPAVAALLLAHAGDTLSGTLGFDPIGTLAATGRLDAGLERATELAADFAGLASRSHPGLRALRVDTRAWHLAGASEAQEIAVAIATGIAYLRALDEAGLDIETAADQIAFTLTSDADFFASISKLRAARRLWAKATAACGIAPAAMALTIETAERMMSTRDPWVNMLRTTVACFAAGIAGAQTVVVQPYSAAAGLPDGFARRMARNTQIILQEESSLGRVLDPAGGSWYVENLTDDLGNAAWALFQQIEAEGGMTRSLAAGAIQARIAETQAARAKNIARRKDPLTGVSEFAKIDEAPADVVETDASLPATAPVAAPLSGSGAEALIAAARQGATASALMAALSAAGDTITPLPRHRSAEDFERLRNRADVLARAAGKRPSVFLANLGSPAAFTARSTFARNFFGAGGIDAVASEGCASAQEAVEAWRACGSPIAVICSSDSVYGDKAADVARALKEAGAAHIYLAGHPGPAREAYEAAGIATFIHVGCNVVDMLDQAFAHLGVAQS